MQIQAVARVNEPLNYVELFVDLLATDGVTVRNDDALLIARESEADAGADKRANDRTHAHRASQAAPHATWCRRTAMIP